MSSRSSAPRAILDAQREHWADAFAAQAAMYGTGPSEAGRAAIEAFLDEGCTRVVELGAGQGRDTLALLRAGFEVEALDYASEALAKMASSAGPELGPRLHTIVHDVRQPLPLPGASVDACYSHMLFTMALTTRELEALAAEVHRVLRPGGLCVYTVRHTEDPQYGMGVARGDGLFENGGFIVHFFDHDLVKRLARGFTLLGVEAFEEGGLPRRLWRVTMRRK